MTIKVGDTLWMRDSRDSRRGWQSSIIAGETRQSWRMENGSKILKSTMLENLGKWGSQRWHTADGKEAQRWVDARFGIGQRVSSEQNPEMLRKVAEIVGYELPAPKA